MRVQALPVCSRRGSPPGSSPAARLRCRYAQRTPPRSRSWRPGPRARPGSPGSHTAWRSHSRTWRRAEETLLVLHVIPECLYTAEQSTVSLKIAPSSFLQGHLLPDDFRDPSCLSVTGERNALQWWRNGRRGGHFLCGLDSKNY